MFVKSPLFFFATTACLWRLSSGAVVEPPNGKLYFGAWLDSADSSVGAKDGDRPIRLNQRLGFNASLFQFAQDLPIPADSFPFPDDFVDDTKTDAIVLLTVYPRPTPWAIADADIQKLAEQCARLNKLAGRRLLLRFGAEMNGNWNFWGQQPTQFRALWIRVHDAVKAIAPDTGFVWAPSSGNGYPYGQGNPSAEDLALMDTNRNGRVDAQDDPYSPYYPGDEYVEWVGASIYSYGSVFPWSDNIVAPPGKFDAILNDNDFYRRYSTTKNKPYIVTETGAAFHENTPLGPGVGELETKRSWWRQYLTNETFLRTHPNVKAICLFEFQKFEETFADGTPSLRDFRITNESAILSAFLEDLRPVQSFYLVGNSTEGRIYPGMVNNTNRPGSTSTGGNRESKSSGEAVRFGSIFVWCVIILAGFFLAA